MADLLAGKVIAVTGATGIAAAAAGRFAREGAKILVLSIDHEQSARLADQLTALGAENAWQAVDLTDGDATEAAFATGRQQLGRLDGLLAVAGGSGRALGDGALHDLTTEGWKETNDLNGLPAFHAARATVRSMLADASPGSIVIVSSVLAVRPSPQFFATHAYANAKGGAIALVKSCASYYASNGIRFNCIAPGLVDTPMAARAAADSEIVAYAKKKQPLAGGFLQPSEIASAATFLLSDEARMITGQVLAVDGGWSATDIG